MKNAITSALIHERESDSLMSDATEPERRDVLSQREAYLAQLQEALADPLHKRLVAAYSKGSDPVASMEAELGSMLSEIMKDED